MLKDKEPYQVKISNRSAALEDLADIIRAWESIASNTKIAAQESLISSIDDGLRKNALKRV
jgi:hypothetical protein